MSRADQPHLVAGSADSGVRDRSPAWLVPAAVMVGIFGLAALYIAAAQPWITADPLVAVVNGLGNATFAVTAAVFVLLVLRPVTPTPGRFRAARLWLLTAAGITLACMITSMVFHTREGWAAPSGLWGWLLRFGLLALAAAGTLTRLRSDSANERANPIR